MMQDRVKLVPCGGRRAAAAFCAALMCAWLSTARADSPPQAPTGTPSAAKAALPADVSQCATAVERMARGHPAFSAFEWDRGDPRNYIHSTAILETEFNGRMVPVDYTLILVGRLRERQSGRMVDANGTCGMRGGRIIAAHVARSPSHQ